MKKISYYILTFLLMISFAGAAIGIYGFLLFTKDYRYFQANAVSNNFIHISDNLDTSWEEITHRETIISDLYEVSKELHNSKEFEFINVRTTVPIFIPENEYRGSEAFASEYEYKFENDCRVLCIQLGQNAFEHFDISLDEGVLFEETDRLTNANDELPVIMGANYKGLYQIGETFSCYFSRRNYTARVIGFAKAGSNYIRESRAINLDNYMILTFSGKTIGQELGHLKAYEAL